jgi:hypothetical protein
MATDKPTKPPLRRLNTRVDPWNGALPAARSSGSVARDLYPHLKSQGGAQRQPVRREIPTPKGKRW